MAQMSRYARPPAPPLAAERHNTAPGGGFGEFFGAREAMHDDYDNEEDFDELDSYDEDDAEFFGEDAYDMPEAIAEDAEWQELYDNGVTYHDAVRLVYPEFADSYDDDIDLALEEWMSEMSPEEIESFWRSLKRGFRTVVRAAAPVVQAAAPIVGRVVGTAIGGPVGSQIGGAVGGLVGQGAGALGRSMRRRPARSRIRRRPMRRMRRSPARSRYRFRGGNAYRARRRRTRAYRTGRAAGRFARGAGSALVRTLRNPQVQNALYQGAQGAVAGVFGRDQAFSDAAVLYALEGGIQEALREMEEMHGDLDSSETGLVPGDFDSAEDAFVELVDALEDA
ncbi:hypothetical protein [Pontivivens ytuae]|uniref:Uncharacterized protein n=1 Tax=Pontivivens ytuae TaxID=2789856 RepID=A0A7S9LQV7_9RHOB|nr:hypothetical protein [Pontivivens ytuae]QPH53335.1 hypothetical protein I0K15_16310 [Pontivivens ytuae]